MRKVSQRDDFDKLYFNLISLHLFSFTIDLLLGYPRKRMPSHFVETLIQEQEHLRKNC